MANEEYSERDGNMADSVEEFIQVNEVDGSAADALRECSRSVQAAVIDRGGLSGARNPSSVLLARIRDASAPPLNETDMDSAGFVRLRGIPFSATADDILRFFDGMSPLSDSVVIGTTREGRLSGEAFVQFPSVVHAKEAIEQRHRATMGDRYIELFPSTPGEAQRAAHGEPRHGGGWHDRHDDRSSHHWSNSASDRAATADEVEQFLSSSTIDDHAQGALRELSPYMQAAVIDRGGLGNARNPSSVLLSRIRDVQNGVMNSPPPPPPSAVVPRGSKAERVERYLEENSVDEQAAEVFRNCHPDVQEEVMSRPVASARNPSSALRARIRDVEQNLMGGGGGQVRAPSRNLVSAVEDFIQQNGIDERAADALRNSQPRTQEAVLDRGDFVGVRNPSSAVLARIRAADAHLASRDGNNSDRDNYGYHDDGYSGGRSRDGRPHNIEDAVEEFIRANYLDERASEALRGCPPHVQEEVLHRGDLAGTRNPSSALVARLKDIQGPVSGPGRGGGGGPPPPHPAPVPVSLPGGLVDDIEYLLRLYAERDDRAADALGRLRSVKYSVGYYGDRPPGPPPPSRTRSYSPRGSRHYNDRDRLEDHIEGFVRANGIDAKAADALRRADPRTAYTVMEKGVSGARNPSSALLARLRDIETYGAPSGNEHTHGRDRAYDPEPPPRKRGRLEDDVEAFIRANGVDDMAADTLRRCSPELQEVVMEKGVAGARNPSSALLARIRDLDGRMGGGGDRRSYGGNAPPRRGGDRYAPY